MAAIAFKEWTHIGYATLPDALRDAVLASSDWSLAVASRFRTNLTAATTAGATSFTVTTGTAGTANFPNGTVVRIGRGTANAEDLTVSSQGASAITTGASTKPHAVNERVEVMTTHTVTTVTSTGRRLAVDLSTPSATYNGLYLGITVFRDIVDGEGIGARTMYLRYADNIQATNAGLHPMVSASKEFLFLRTHGPYPGEAPNADPNTNYAESLFVGDLLPYDSADTTKPVVTIGMHSASWGQNFYAYLDTAADGLNVWTPAFTASVQRINSDSVVNLFPAKRGTTQFQWPVLLMELTDGPRGRAKHLFFAGHSFGSTQQGARVTRDGITYLAVIPFRTPNIANSSWGQHGGGDAEAPMYWVPVAGTPA